MESRDGEEDLTQIIHENGIDLPITEAQAHCLNKMGLLYHCQEPSCPCYWHITPGFDWPDIDLALVQLGMDGKELDRG